MKREQKALASLWGSGHADATRTRECVAMPGVREQEILTPAPIVAAIGQLWPEGIALDPCAPVGGSLLEPARSYTGGDGLDGLREPWTDRTYCNPPYAELRSWLAKGLNESRQGRAVLMLCPLRTLRPWFQLDPWRRVCLLRPVKFAGYAQAFPAPLCLLYNGQRPDAFDRAFSPLGCVGSWSNSYRRQGDLLQDSAETK